MSSANPLRAKYSDSLPTLASIFPDWDEDDLLQAIDDARGSLDTAVDRISTGQSCLPFLPSLLLRSVVGEVGQRTVWAWVRVGEVV